MAFTPGNNIATKVAAGAAVFGAATQAVNTARNLGTALSNFSSLAEGAGGIGTAIRSINLPAGGGKAPALG